MFFSTLLSVNDIKIEPRASPCTEGKEGRPEEEQQFQYLDWLDFSESGSDHPQLETIKKKVPAFKNARLIDRLDEVFSKRYRKPKPRKEKEAAINVLPRLNPPNILVHLDTSMIMPGTSSTPERTVPVSPILQTQILKSVDQSIESEDTEKGASERKSVERKVVNFSSEKNCAPVLRNSINDSTITPIRKGSRSIRRRLFNSPYATPEYKTPRASMGAAEPLNPPSMHPQLRKVKTRFPEPEPFGTVLRKTRSVFQDPQALLDTASRAPSETPSCLLSLLKRKSLLKQRKRVSEESISDDFSRSLVTETPLRVQQVKGDEKSNDADKFEKFFDKICKESPMVHDK